MLRLVARHGDQVRSFPLPAANAVIGASSACELVLPFRGVSRRHARLEPAGGGFLVVDLSSKNGIFWQGERRPKALLGPGDEVRLGPVALALEEVPSSEAEVALRLGSGSGERRRSPAGTATALFSPARSAAAALAFVREHERRRQVAGALAAAREVLGTESLLLLRTRGDEAAVVECHGPLPAGDLDEIAWTAGESEVTELPPTVGRGPALACRGRGDACLLAVFADGHGRPTAWEVEFFAYLARHVAGAAPEPRREASPAPPDLRLPPGMVLGGSPAMRRLLEEIGAAVRGRIDVLLVGETGTGKELVAKLLHASGPSAAGPFLAINCAAIPTELLEAELFGIEAGVATGVERRVGLFVRAHGGTLFLDEVTELAPALQAKLLRVLQEREVRPVGAAQARAIDVRVVAATNRELAPLVAEGRFRVDLYYRLAGFELRVPPLRERPEDLSHLVTTFAGRAAAASGKRVLGVSRRALELLAAHPWPGNVRELETAVTRAILRCPDGAVLGSEHFRELVQPPPSAATLSEQAPRAAPAAVPSTPSLRERVDETERQAILDALAVAGRNKSRAAKALGITRNGLALKMRRLGLS